MDFHLHGIPASNSHYLPNIIKENHTDIHILMEEDVLKPWTLASVSLK